MTTDTPRRPPSWRQMQADTALWAERLQFKFFRESPAWRKLESAGNLTGWAIDMAQAEIERRYPRASPAEVRRRLADKILGPKLAAHVYGPLIPGDEADKHGTGA
jgi:hypothetical protein